MRLFNSYDPLDDDFNRDMYSVGNSPEKRKPGRPKKNTNDGPSKPGNWKKVNTPPVTYKKQPFESAHLSQNLDLQQIAARQLAQQHSFEDEEPINIIAEIDGAVELMRKSIISEVIYQCGWSIPTFYRKKKFPGEVGQSRISNAETRIIAEVAAKFGSDFNNTLTNIVKKFWK